MERTTVSLTQNIYIFGISAVLNSTHRFHRSALKIQNVLEGEKILILEAFWSKWASVA